jgi:hypothetical protein
VDVLLSDEDIDALGEIFQKVKCEDPLTFAEFIEMWRLGFQLTWSVNRARLRLRQGR